MGLLDTIAETQPSIVLLDLRIPGCDSLAALAEVRARHPELVVMVVSGFDDPEVVAEAFTHGASGFFVKSMDLEALPGAIRSAVAGKRVGEERARSGAPRPGAPRGPRVP